MYAEESKSRPSQEVKNGGRNRRLSVAGRKAREKDNEAGVDSKLQW
jgi:hypothetical protein